MSSADGPRFDATAAAQQMLALQDASANLPGQQNTATVREAGRPGSFPGF